MEDKTDIHESFDWAHLLHYFSSTAPAANSIPWQEEAVLLTENAGHVFLIPVFLFFSQKLTTRKELYMRTSVYGVSIIALLTISAVPAVADNFKRIKTAEEFNALVVGKKIDWDGGSAIIYGNWQNRREAQQTG